MTIAEIFDSGIGKQGARTSCSFLSEPFRLLVVREPQEPTSKVVAGDEAGVQISSKCGKAKGSR